jgi:hypothetical protein
MMEFSESSFAARSPFSYEEDDTVSVPVLKPKMPKSEGLKYSSDDLLKEMSTIERNEDQSVDFYGMGNEQCEDEEDENWALRDDLKNQKEIELLDSNENTQQVPAVDIAIAAASPSTKSRYTTTKQYDHTTTTLRFVIVVSFNLY